MTLISRLNHSKNSIKEKSEKYKPSDLIKRKPLPTIGPDSLEDVIERVVDKHYHKNGKSKQKKAIVILPKGLTK